MPGTTTNLGLRYPVAADAPDGAGAFFNLASDIDQMLRMGGAEYAANLAALQAIPTARCFGGKLGYAADTGAIYRWNGSAWTLWTWIAIPLGNYATLNNGAGSPSVEGSIASGIVTLNFILTKSAGMGADISYMQMLPGLRPAGNWHFGGETNNGSNQRTPAALRVESDGNVYLTSNGGVSVTSMAGSVSFRAYS